jgi:hypothetical protein
MIYEVSVKNVRLANLRSDANVQAILSGYYDVLMEAKSAANASLSWAVRKRMNQATSLLARHQVGVSNLSELAGYGLGGYFTRYLRSLGYDGIVAYEGGEGSYVGRHDTYVLFDPEKAHVIESHEVV